MRRKRLLCIFLALVSPLLLNARGQGDKFIDRVQFGLEWGYSQNIFRYHHFNIISDDGYRIDEKTEGLLFDPSGLLLGNVGYDLSDRFNIALYSGYSGFAGANRVIPIALRLSVFPGSTIFEDGFFSFVEGGAGLRFKQLETQAPALYASIGEAYRVKLSPYVNLDFALCLRVVFDTPMISHPTGKGYVAQENIRANAAQYYALNFSIALNF